MTTQTLFSLMNFYETFNEIVNESFSPKIFMKFSIYIHGLLFVWVMGPQRFVTLCKLAL